MEIELEILLFDVLNLLPAKYPPPLAARAVAAGDRIDAVEGDVNVEVDVIGRSENDADDDDDGTRFTSK